MSSEKPRDTHNTWGLSAEEYRRRMAEKIGHPTPVSHSIDGGSPLARTSARTTGRITWRPDEVNFGLIGESSTERSLYRLQRSMPLLVWNAAALEGNTFTLPQVHTLLDGVTVGGKRIEEAEQILALSEAMNLMVAAVHDGSFSLSKSFSDRVHGIVAQHEAIEAGNFRGEGMVQGGGAVRLAAGGMVDGDPAGETGEHLRADFENLIAALGTLSDPRARALVYFCSATRSQFYFDGNKRTARIMMTGALVHAGYEPVNIPFARQEEFNTALDALFTTDDATALLDFLTTCSLV